jgi:hypothetical protein
MEPRVSQQIKSPNKLLGAVKAYIDLISRDAPLVYGSGLKRLYALSSGVATLNDADIEAIAEKTERLKVLDTNLDIFMMECILKNISLYGQEIKRLLHARIVAIANGDVRNAEPALKFSADEARRNFYVPASSLVLRIQKVLGDYVNAKYTVGMVAASIDDVTHEALFTLSRSQLQEGHLTPVETSWGALARIIDELTDLMDREARHVYQGVHYKDGARPALTILWVIAKLLMGDLTNDPFRKDINMVDLDSKVNLSDGTLAAIPFPLRNTVDVFADTDHYGVSMKGRVYLSTVSAAAFYRSSPSDE